MQPKFTKKQDVYDTLTHTEGFIGRVEDRGEGIIDGTRYRYAIVASSGDHLVWRLETEIRHVREYVFGERVRRRSHASGEWMEGIVVQTKDKDGAPIYRVAVERHFDRNKHSQAVEWYTTENMERVT